MKKQNNILRYVKLIANIAFISFLFQACTDEEIIKSSNVEEGIPVEVSFNFSAPEMNNISTRSLTGKEENNINDIYILIFDLNKQRVDGKLYEKGVDFNPTTHSANTNTGTIKLVTTSGERRIYAIANVRDNELNGKGQSWLLNELDNVKTIDKLEEITVAMDITQSISVDRVSENMVMSGEFDDEKNSNIPGYCVIPSKSGQAVSGVLNLTRLDSKITFEIYLGSKITKFEPKEWQVFNVPVLSYILEQEKDAGGTIDKKNYANSMAFNNQYITAEEDENASGTIKEKYSFTFYQLENLKKSKDYQGEKLTEYKMREAEVKNSDGTNSDVYKFVEPFASYVQFKAYMEIRLQDGTTRVANIRIITHLGGKNHPNEKLDPTNFNNRRNKKYTYKITINDADDIKTEVEMENGNENEPRPGIEGDVIDSKSEARVLDAHYNCFNVGLSYNDVLAMGFQVHTPFAEVTTEYAASDKETKEPSDKTGDYNWVKFKYNAQYSTRNKVLATYTNNQNNPTNDADNGRLNIYQLRNDVMNRGRNNKNQKLYYTVFVDEYYYKEMPCKGLSWGNNPQVYWKYFVNQDDRYIMLLYTPKKSTDQDSSYGRAEYFIRQKSIQTYYSTTNLTDEKTALGMEHTNESQPLSWGGPKEEDRDKDNGYYNTYEYVGNENWSDYVSSKQISGTYYWTADENNNTFQMSSNKAVAACLSRNRDKNGNGKIDEDELEWYVPTSRQLSSMYLGAQSLPSPLFTPPATGKVAYDDTKYHFQTSDGDKIWAQEGCSNGGTDAQQVRCVRNLGLEISNPTSKDANKVATPYKRVQLSGKDSERIIYDLSCVNPLNLRQNTTVSINYHVNFNETKNLPYYRFELAQNFLESSKLDAGSNSWNAYSNKDLCSNYSESENDKGEWRTPNQRELLIIFNEGKEKMFYQKHEQVWVKDNHWPYYGHYEDKYTNYGMYSCTYWLYSAPQYAGANQQRVFAIHANAGNYFLDGGGNPQHTNYGSILRCVRDIKIDN